MKLWTLDLSSVGTTLYTVCYINFTVGLQIENTLPVGASFNDALRHLGETLLIFQRKLDLRDFPGGPVVRTTLQCRGGRFNSWSGNQDSPRRGTTKAALHNWKCTCHSDRSPQVTVKIPRAATKTQHSQINKHFKIKSYFVEGLKILK